MSVEYQISMDEQSKKTVRACPKCGAETRPTLKDGTCSDCYHRERRKGQPPKKCSKCGLPKTWDQIYYGRATCKECDKKYTKEYIKKNHTAHLAAVKRWSEAHPGHAKPSDRKRRYERRYGITQEEFKAMLVKQNYRCAICGTQRRLVIDHDHQTKKVRGLLCYPCNRELPLLEDAELLAKALSYLKGNG